MKKVFFIINTYSKGGGAETLLTNIVNRLSPEKYQIGIMEIIHDTVKIEPVNKSIQIYPYYVEADHPERKARMYYVYHEWDKVITEYIPQDYDLYVSFNYLKPSFLLPPGKKCISWIHGDVYNLVGKKMEEERKLQSLAFEKADVIVAISDITAQSLIDVFPEHQKKMHLIYNGIDLKQVREKAEVHSDVVLQHPAVLSVGRLDNNKNPIRLLDIFRKVHSREPRAHLYYLGYGALAEEICKKAMDMGLKDNVHILGYYDNPFPIMVQCDICGMFSKSEGFPMALLESVALDKPFVSSIIGGARILADNQQCGRTVETDEEAAEAIMTLLAADKQKIMENCRKSIARFNIEEYIKKIEDLFDEVMKGKWL